MRRVAPKLRRRQVPHVRCGAVQNPSVFDVVRSLFEQKGGSMYLGEPVTQEEHALQCAWLAEQEGAEAALVVAALLHDIGHLLCALEMDTSTPEVDAKHETRGQEWLAGFFGLEVTEPVRMHVDAKRYLCAFDLNYTKSLSDASRHSLMLQGGPMTEEEAWAFASTRFSNAALRLRRWDDQAKIPGLVTPELAHYASAIETLIAGPGRQR